MAKFWIPKHVDLKIAAQIMHMEKKTAQTGPAPFITISRDYGCDGLDIANAVIQRLNTGGDSWYLFQRHMLTSQQGVELSDERMRQLDEFGHSDVHSYIREALFGMPNQRETVEKLAKITFLLAQNGKVVFLGGGAALLTRSIPSGVHIRIHASESWRVANYQKRWKNQEGNAEMGAHEFVQKQSRERERFIKTFLGENVHDSKHYDLMINNERISAEEVAEITVALLGRRGLL